MFIMFAAPSPAPRVHTQISRHPGGAAERDMRMEQLVWRVWALKRRRAGVVAAKQLHHIEVSTTLRAWYVRSGELN